MPSLSRLEASFVSRSPNAKGQKKHGQNSIAHSAYIRRETLTDERTGERFYGLKMGQGQDAEWKDVYTPEGAPAWMRNPGKLWNAVEAREDISKRSDKALLSRSWIGTFPSELTLDQCIWMAKDVMREMARDGWVIDGAIHGPDKDNENRHWHGQSPMRHITKDGLGLRRALFEKGGQSMREELIGWKAKWSAAGERQLRRAGFEEAADRYKHGHKTNREQFLEAIKRGDFEWAREKNHIPHVHMGPGPSAKEARGEPSRLGDQNRKIDELNRLRDIEFDRKYGFTPKREPEKQREKQPYRKATKRTRTNPRASEPAVKFVRGVGRSLVRLAVDLAPPLTPEQLRQGQRRQERDDAEAEWNQKQRDFERDDRDR